LRCCAPLPKTSAHTGDLRSTEDFPLPRNDRGPLPTPVNHNPTEARAWVPGFARAMHVPSSPKAPEDPSQSNSRVRHSPMLDQADQENAHAQALRDADYASLTRRAATENSRSPVDEVLRRITATEAGTRKRQRASRADAFRMAIERRGPIGRKG
jgi:hypothetical protein